MPAVVMLAGMLTFLASACPTDGLFSGYDGAQPGASVCVIKDGAVVLERSYGMANVEAGEKATPETNFRLASVTKQFTAMAIMMLAEKKALSIDDPVLKHLPELGPGAGKVTLRHLLIHTSGIPEYEPLLAKDDTRQVLDKDVLDLLVQQKLALTPGRYRYNNSEYALLALIVERVSKQAFGEYLKANIFKPLGMTSTQVYDAKATIARRAYGYGEGSSRNDQSRTSAVLGDGGIYSSTRDLVRWIDALDHHTLVSPKLLAEATSPLVATDVAGVSYGFGFRVTQERGEKLVFHTGLTSGFKNALLWVPSRRLAVIVLTNRRQGDPLMLATMVLYQFWDH